MTGTNPELPSYVEGSTPAFLVLASFGHSGLLQGAGGETFVVQPIDARPGAVGGHISTILQPTIEVTFRVEHSFASGYLILSGPDAWYLATQVAPDRQH